MGNVIGVMAYSTASRLAVSVRRADQCGPISDVDHNIPPPTFPRSSQAATRHGVLASSGAGAGNVCAVCNTKALFSLLVPKEPMSTAAYTVG